MVRNGTCCSAMFSTKENSTYQSYTNVHTLIRVYVSLRYFSKGSASYERRRNRLRYLFLTRLHSDHGNTSDLYWTFTVFVFDSTPDDGPEKAHPQLAVIAVPSSHSESMRAGKDGSQVVRFGRGPLRSDAIITPSFLPMNLERTSTRCATSLSAMICSELSALLRKFWFAVLCVREDFEQGVRQSHYRFARRAAFVALRHAARVPKGTSRCIASLSSVHASATASTKAASLAL